MSLPVQEEIDELGGGKTIRDWENRFELAYRKCKEENVTLVGGVAPTAVSFARYTVLTCWRQCLHRKPKVLPKDLGGTQLVTLGSVPGINRSYRPAVRARRPGCHP